MTCEAEGVPTPYVSWTRDGIVVSSIQSKPGVNELKFTPEGANDFGDYVCTAKNLLGSTKKTITIGELGKLCHHNLRKRNSIGLTERNFKTERRSYLDLYSCLKNLHQVKYLNLQEG